MCIRDRNTAVIETQTSLDDVSSSTAEAQTTTTPVDLVMVQTQTVWTDCNDDSHVAVHPVDRDLVQVDQLNDIENPLNTDVILRARNESEITDSSSESIYIEDYSSSTESSFTDAEEDYGDTVVPDSSLEADYNTEAVSDKHSHLLDSEYVETSPDDVNLQERDSHSLQSVEVTDDNGAPRVETFDVGDIPALNPPVPDLVSTEQQPAGTDVGADVSSHSQVSCVARGCGDGASTCVHASLSAWTSSYIEYNAHFLLRALWNECRIVLA